jgi:hypothetical protein
MRILKTITATVYLKGHYRSAFYAYFIPIECKREERGQGLKDYYMVFECLIAGAKKITSTWGCYAQLPVYDHQRFGVT